MTFLHDVAVVKCLNPEHLSSAFRGRILDSVTSQNATLYVSFCERISGTASPICKKFFVHVPCSRDSVLLQRRDDTLCTSGFVDNVTFRRNRS